MTINIEPECYAIKSTRELPEGWPVQEWTPIEVSEAQSLSKSLYPRIVNILNGDQDELNALLHPKGFWRDFVSLTWTFRTFHGKDKIAETIPALLARAGVRDVEAIKESGIVGLPIGGAVLRVTVPFSTTTPETKCLGIFKFIRLQNGDIKLFTVSTQLLEVGAAPWKDPRNAKPVSKELPEKVEILVVGGGHGGLAIGAYLSALGQNFAIIDREQEVGDSWAKRYDSAVLHTIRVFSGLPFMPFPKDYPNWVDRQRLADFYKVYARELNLPIYQNTAAEHAVFDEEKKLWTVQTSQGPVVAKILLFAVGVFGRHPNIPAYPGQDVFKGQQLHSVIYKNPSAWKGKKVIVIGAATTGLDVAFDCSQLGIDITLVQRGPTRIYAPGHVQEFQEGFYNENSPAVRGDQLTTEDPVALQAQLAACVLNHQTESYDKAYYDGLDAAGFKGIYSGAMHEQVLIQGGRHYPDIGAGHAIIRGEIKVKSDSEVAGLDETGVIFADGSHLDADVVVYCTGFKKDTRGVIADIIGDDYKLEGVWGLDKEGEIRGVFRPTGHDHVWQMGGELYCMRYYGQWLAMQLAALLAGVRPEPVRA